MRAWLAPERADLTDARGAVSALAPEVAWRAVSALGLISSSWLDDPARRFIEDPGDHYRKDLPTRDPIRARVHAHPALVDDALRFAADIEGVLAAETAARDLIAALAPWGAPAFDHVRWWSIPRERFNFASTDTRPGVSYALLFAAMALSRATKKTGDVPMRMFEQAAGWSARWSAAADTVIDAEDARHDDLQHLVGRPFGSLPDPFAALAAITAAGYATLEGIGIEGAARGAVVLVCPA